MWQIKNMSESNIYTQIYVNQHKTNPKYIMIGEYA